MNGTPKRALYGEMECASYRPPRQH